jgi:hypothetical protein
MVVMASCPPAPPFECRIIYVLSRCPAVDTKGPEIRTGRFVSIFLLSSLIVAILTFRSTSRRC